MGPLLYKHEDDNVKIILIAYLQSYCFLKCINALFKAVAYHLFKPNGLLVVVS